MNTGHLSFRGQNTSYSSTTLYSVVEVERHPGAVHFFKSIQHMGQVKGSCPVDAKTTLVFRSSTCIVLFTRLPSTSQEPKVCDIT